MMIFSIEKQESVYYEEEIVKKFCDKNSSYKYLYLKSPLKNSIPIGSVEYCEKVYGNITPCYYPEFLKKYLNRDIYLDKYDPNKSYCNLFVKPADKYKKFNGTTNFKSKYNKGCKIWCSDIIKFINEWRYYIADGHMIGSAWYDGNITNEDYFNNLIPPAPILPNSLKIYLRDIKYCGVLDFGIVNINNKNTLTLVEACHPYGVGWYLNNEDDKYINFLISSDNYLKKT